jgi:hypothetical protein
LVLRRGDGGRGTEDGDFLEVLEIGEVYGVWDWFFEAIMSDE